MSIDDEKTVGNVPDPGVLANGDMSQSDAETVAGAPGREENDNSDLSMGDIRTEVSPGKTPSGKGGTGTPLTERYELLEEIGRGGFAVVWKAKDRRLERIVAIKRLRPEALEGPLGRQTLERFEREASAIARLNQRNIVMVYDQDKDEEGHYIVMEYVPDGTLREYVSSRGGKLDKKGKTLWIRQKIMD